MAKERPCMRKDAKLVVGFGGHLGSVVSGKKNMANGEAQTIE